MPSTSRLEAILPKTLVDYCKEKRLELGVEDFSIIAKEIPFQGARALARTSVVLVEENKHGMINFSVKLLDKNGKRLMQVDQLFKNQVFFKGRFFDGYTSDSDDEPSETEILQKLMPKTEENVTDWIKFVNEYHFGRAVANPPVKNLAELSQEPEEKEQCLGLGPTSAIHESDDLGRVSCVIS